MCKEKSYEVADREDMEKAFSIALSNLNPIMVAGYGPIEKRGRRASRPPILPSSVYYI